MQKKFYVSSSLKNGDGAQKGTPKMDKFQRVEQLNDMLDLGWTIKGFETGGDGSYFLLEKKSG